MLLFLLATLGDAHAACPDPAAAVEVARDAVLALKDEVAAEALATAELGLTCGAWATPELLADLGRRGAAGDYCIWVASGSGGAGQRAGDLRAHVPSAR